MKIAMICAVILSATTVGAATTIENPDHFYVKSTGVQFAAATPVTNSGNTMPPLDPAEERAAELLIQQLQMEWNELMIPKEGETPDQVAFREQAASEKLRRINKLKSVLLQLPVQSIEGEAAHMEPMVVYALGIVAYCGYLTVKDVVRF
jgi:hypothetical protein